MNRSNLLEYVVKSDNKSKPKTKEDKAKKNF